MFQIEMRVSEIEAFRNIAVFNHLLLRKINILYRGKDVWKYWLGEYIKCI